VRVRMMKPIGIAIVALGLSVAGCSKKRVEAE
jgi:hypothetical protein